jgi:hypothetical protein
MIKPDEYEEFLDTTAPTLILDDDDEEEIEYAETHPDLVELVEFFDEENPEDLEDMESDLIE